MSASLSLHLEFGSEVPPAVRSRISYAFRVYAAIYGHTVVDNGSENSATPCFYGDASLAADRRRAFHIPHLYRDSTGSQELPRLQVHRYADENFYLACGIDAASGTPDWLGEIFLWLSSSYEMSIVNRDAVGRIPFSEMIFSRQNISSRKPHAALLMAWLQNALTSPNGKQMLPKAPSPAPGIAHLVVCSHDIDFYFTNRSTALLRLAKNLAIALNTYKSWSYFRDNLAMMGRLAAGARVGDYLPALLRAAGELEFQSTVFVVPRHGHRRDPQYSLQQIEPRLREAQEQGFSIGLHGSYRSVVEDRTLASEAASLGTSASRPRDGRQHWLRFTNHQELFAQIERAALTCDLTLGFPETVGFRNGASFAFPPYDFAKEKPCEFLELPLVLMDGSLEAASRHLRVHPQELADEVLNESRKTGWGGISLLWHNPVEPLSVPHEINRVFWDSARAQKEFCEKWVSAKQFLALSLRRYHQAGLLSTINPAKNA